MHIVKFQEWAKDRANYPPYGLTPDQARIEFDRIAADPEELTDELGPTKEFKLRVGVIIQDLAIEREALVKEQGYELQDCFVFCTIRPSVLLAEHVTIMIIRFVIACASIG